MREDISTQLPVQPQIIMVAVAVILSVGVFVSPYALDTLMLEKKEVSLNTTAQVIESNATSVGATTDNDSLAFGRMVSDKMNFTRSINIQTGNDTIVLVDVEGNITDHLEYDDVNRFNGSKELTFKMVAREPGNYTGTIDLNVHAANSEGASTWLDIKQAFY